MLSTEILTCKTCHKNVIIFGVFPILKMITYLAYNPLLELTTSSFMYEDKKSYNKIYYVILTTSKSILTCLINQAINLYTKQTA